MTLSLLMAVATLLNTSPALPQRLSLTGSWRVSQVERGITIPASVPGVIQLDLLKAGKIPDPYLSDNEKKVQWVSDVPWDYSRQFTVTPEFLQNPHIVLRCEGLDTFATVSINGREVAKTDNMYRAWEFDAKPFLVAGENTIRVQFETLSSFLKRNDGRSLQFDRPVQEEGRSYIRKAAFQGGWDFAPRLLTTGIWRDINLIGWKEGRITGVRVDQQHKAHSVQLSVHADGTVPTGGTAHAIVRWKGKVVAEASGADLQLTIENPQLWWPAGMGKPNLYDLEVTLRDREGRVVDRANRRVGLRTVTWIPKTEKNPLALVVNGHRFFAKGSNWVPTDSLLREDPKRDRKLLQHAVDANMNLMRLWGGGFYVGDAFLDTCDELGLLVWFEFGYACSSYPSYDPQWLANARGEAEDAVKRIQTHPSIAVYSGNNEVTDRLADKASSWQMSREDYALLFHKTLREVVHQLAPDAAYTPGSPEVGDTHYWTVWHGAEDFTAYRKLHGFMSEYGFQAIPVPKSLETYTTSEDRTAFTNPGMANHQKNWRDAHALIVSTFRRSYRKAKDMESVVWLSQIQQAEGIITGVEHWRRDWPHSSASLVWQFNDCWPGSSWSMIDYYGRPKALLYRLKHAYAPVALSGIAEEKETKASLWVANDRFEAKLGQIDWVLTKVDGTVLRKGAEKVQIPAGTSSLQALTLDFGSLPRKDLLLWSTLRVAGEPESHSLVTFERPKELDLVDPKIEASVSATAKGFKVTLTSKYPALYAWVDLKGLDAEFSDNFVHLRPGAPVSVEVTAKATLTEVKKALVARSLYDTYDPNTLAHVVLSPKANGEIVAPVEDAEVRGNGPSLEFGEPSNLGGWRSVDNSVEWDIRDAKTGTYRVSAVISCPSGDAGGTFEVAVGESRLSSTVTPTASWTDYKTFELGTLTITKAGNTTLIVRPLTKPHDNLMNLRSITLTPLR